jgi:hypothetical protein
MYIICKKQENKQIPMHSLINIFFSLTEAIRIGSKENWSDNTAPNGMLASSHDNIWFG